MQNRCLTFLFVVVCSQIGDSLFLDLPRVRLDGGGKAFRKQWGYEMAPPPTLLEEEEDQEEEDGEEDDLSETQSLREDAYSRQSALGQSRADRPATSHILHHEDCQQTLPCM